MGSVDKENIYERLDDCIDTSGNTCLVVEYIAINHGYTCSKCEHLRHNLCISHHLECVSLVANSEYNFCSHFTTKIGSKFRI